MESVSWWGEGGGLGKGEGGEVKGGGGGGRIGEEGKWGVCGGRLNLPLYGFIPRRKLFILYVCTRRPHPSKSGPSLIFSHL